MLLDMMSFKRSYQHLLSNIINSNIYVFNIQKKMTCQKASHFHLFKSQIQRDNIRLHSYRFCVMSVSYF